MKKAVIVEFESVPALRQFKKDRGLINCVVIDNTLTCYLDEQDIQSLGFYAGKILEEICDRHRNFRMAARQHL